MKRFETENGVLIIEQKSKIDFTEDTNRDEVERSEKIMSRPSKKPDDLFSFKSELMTIQGIGPKKAAELERFGIKTRDDLEKSGVYKSMSKMTIADMQYKPLLSIPRESIVQFEKKFRNWISEELLLAHGRIPEGIDALCMGSVRRNKPKCGDVDIVVSIPLTGADPKKLLAYAKKFHPAESDVAIDTQLEKSDFGPKLYKDVDLVLEAQTFESLLWKWILSFSNEEYIFHKPFAIGPSRITTYCYFADLGRNIQVDIFFAQQHELAFRVLYSTGSAEFNKRMRNVAISRGLKLSDTGLFNRKTNKKVEGDFPDEISIFDRLFIKWREPISRSV